VRSCYGHLRPGLNQNGPKLNFPSETEEPFVGRLLRSLFECCSCETPASSCVAYPQRNPRKQSSRLLTRNAGISQAGCATAIENYSRQPCSRPLAKKKSLSLTPIQYRSLKPFAVGRRQSRRIPNAVTTPPRKLPRFEYLRLSCRMILVTGKLPNHVTPLPTRSPINLCPKISR
jgi:hypothetical protein